MKLVFLFNICLYAHYNGIHQSHSTCSWIKDDTLPAVHRLHLVNRRSTGRGSVQQVIIHHIGPRN